MNTVAYDDGAKGRRNIAHRLSVSEMIVPYGCPAHYRQNAFDLGECGLGKNAHSLTLVSAPLARSTLPCRCPSPSSHL